MRKYILSLAALLLCVTNTYAANDNRYENLINCSANNLVILGTAVPSRGLSDKDAKAYLYSTVITVSKALELHDEIKVKEDLTDLANIIYENKGKYGISEYSGFSNQQLANFVNNSIRQSDKYCSPFLGEVRETLLLKPDPNNPKTATFEKRIQDSTKLVLNLLKVRK